MEKEPHVTLAYHFEQTDAGPKPLGSEEHEYFIADASRHGLRVDDLCLVRAAVG